MSTVSSEDLPVRCSYNVGLWFRTDVSNYGLLLSFTTLKHDPVFSVTVRQWCGMDIVVKHLLLFLREDVFSQLLVE